jgi:lipid-binding SYLF domain-containing protein
VTRSVRAYPLALLAAIALAIAAAAAPDAYAESASELQRDGRAALKRLEASQPSARLLASKAKAVLVFPHMVKAGFMFGGQLGEGVLFKKGKVAGYFNSVAASYGLQAGAQTFGYALYFMTDDALRQLDATHGFELGVGPSIVVVDEGMGKSMTTNTITSDVYAFIFSQKGLMAGLGVQGSKITRISK